MKAKEQDIQATTFLRGIAILAVILLHSLSSLHQAYVPANFPGIIILDQLARFCVPLFVALSGYALMKRYGAQLPLLSFFKKRLWKLIPLYLLWSLIFTFALSVGHFALSLQTLSSFWHNLLYGQADYQLYFVPMIICLYALFPALRVFVNRKPNLSFIIAVLIQLGVFLWLSPAAVRYFATDQSFVFHNQYLVFLSWIAYFVMGMWFALKPSVKVTKLELTVFTSLILVGLAFAIQGSLGAVGAGIDSNPALRFTRFPVMIYSLGFIGLSLGLRKRILVWSKPLSGVIGFIGRESYLIYLSHTLMLRLAFSLYYREGTLSSLVEMTFFLLGGLFLSKFL